MVGAGRWWADAESCVGRELNTYIFAEVILKSLPQYLLADDLCDKACHGCGICGRFVVRLSTRFLKGGSRPLVDEIHNKAIPNRGSCRRLLAWIAVWEFSVTGMRCSGCRTLKRCRAYYSWINVLTSAQYIEGRESGSEGAPFFMGIFQLGILTSYHDLNQSLLELL